jgi:hypothetical protein
MIEYLMKASEKWGSGPEDSTDEGWRKRREEKLIQNIPPERVFRVMPPPALDYIVYDFPLNERKEPR